MARCPPGPPDSLRDGAFDWHRRERELLAVRFHRRLAEGEELAGAGLSVEFWEWLNHGWVERTADFGDPSAVVAQEGRAVHFWAESANGGPEAHRVFAVGIEVTTDAGRRLFATPQLLVRDAASE